MKSPDVARRWLAAMSAGRDALPRCEAIKANGEPCRFHQMKGSLFCIHHIPTAEMAKRDQEERVRLQQFVVDRRASVSTVERALNAIVAIEKRMLVRLWRAGQWDHPGATLYLNPHDEEAVRRRLLLDHIDIMSGAISPRTIDKLRWAAFHVLRGRYTERRYQKSVQGLLQGEARWRATHGMD